MVRFENVAVNTYLPRLSVNLTLSAALVREVPGLGRAELRRGVDTLRVEDPAVDAPQPAEAVAAEFEGACHNLTARAAEGPAGATARARVRHVSVHAEFHQLPLRT